MGFLDDIIDEKKAKRYIEQGTPEWDSIRVGRFTSSQFWQLMVEPREKAAQEVGKWSEKATTYIQEKAAEVMTGEQKQQGYAFPLVWGKEKEFEAKDFWSEQTGLLIETCGFFPYTDHAGGSPDGLVGDDAILEIKCPYDSSKQLDYLALTDHFDLKRDFREIYWQVQCNMLFTERNKAYLGTFDPRMKEDKHKLFRMEIPAIPEEQDLIRKKIEKAVKEKLIILNRFK